MALALLATRVDIAPALKNSRTRDRRPVQARQRWLALVVTQIALSLLLLVTAGLFGRTLSDLHAIALGFNREHLLLFTIRPVSVGYQGPALPRLFEDLRGRLGHVPGVRDVSLSIAPLPMGGGTMAPVAIAGAPETAGPPKAVLASVGPRFFSTMRIPLLAGREFTDSDRANAPPVVVINRGLAGLFGTQSVGRTMTLGDDRFEIVGVAEDALSFTLKEARRPAAYFAYLQSARPPGRMTYEIRTAGDPTSVATDVRDVVRQVDSRIAIHDLKTQAVHIDQAISTEITLAKLCSVFALLALVIACVGLYGTLTFNVAQRTTEIGIRAALGHRPAASSDDLKDVLIMAGVGLAIGIRSCWGQRAT